MFSNLSQLEKFGWSMAIATLLTGGTYLFALNMGWIATVNLLEVLAVFASYACTFLCTMQSRINYPIGAIATASLMLLFFQQGLYGSAMLNAYLFPTLLYGWFRWKSDDNPKPVTLVKPIWWLGYAVITAVVGGLLFWIAGIYSVTLLPADITIMVLSVLAQFLLDNKKLENWIVWAIGNVIAIYTYATMGLPLVALQFVFFLANTVWAFFVWKKTMAKPTEVSGKTSDPYVPWKPGDGVKGGVVPIMLSSSNYKGRQETRKATLHNQLQQRKWEENRRSEDIDSTNLIIAAAILSSSPDTSPSSVEPKETFTGHGGDFGGAGASSGWDSTPSYTPSDTSPSYSSSDSGSSYSSSDSGYSSSDSSTY